MLGCLSSRTVLERLQRDIQRLLCYLLDTLPGWPVHEQLQWDIGRHLCIMLDILPGRAVPKRLQRDIQRHLCSLLNVLPGWPLPKRLQRDLCWRMYLLSVWLHLSWGRFGSYSVQRRFVLWQRVVGWDRVPKRIRLPSWGVRPSTLSVRLQVPCWIDEHDRVCSALLLPQSGLLEPDSLPRRVLLRYKRHVHS